MYTMYSILIREYFMRILHFVHILLYIYHHLLLYCTTVQDCKCFSLFIMKWD